MNGKQPSEQLARKVKHQAAKAISDAPNLRDRFNAARIHCKYFQAIEGSMTNEGICTLYDFATNMDYVCDSFEQITPPDVVEQVAEAIVEVVGMDAEKSLVAYGGEIKSLNDGHIGGYLVRFGSPNDTDAEGEYFDANTDYGFGKGEEITSPVWLNHCQPMQTANGKAIAIREPIGQSTLKMVDDGILIDAVLYERSQYEKILDYLGWSSGTANHTIKRKQNGKSTYIARWHLGLDASVTPKHADPRNTVVSLKSLQTNIDPKAIAKEDAGTASSSNAAGTQATAAHAETTISTAQAGGLPIKGRDMEAAEFKSMLDDAIKPYVQTVETLSKDVKTYTDILKAEPPVNGQKGIGVAVTRDPADTPFKNLAEQCLAVRNFTVSMGQTVAPRVKFLKNMELDNIKATGASEGVPPDGGLLLDPTLTSEFIKPIHQEGVFSSKVRKLPVSNNSNSGWINGVDETSRVTGSRWGGVRGYRLAEGGTKTASKPTFRRIQWELKKYAVLVYSTDELLQDSAMFSEIVNTACREELVFMLNDDIMNGIGLSGPQGFMNSGALITVTRDTGSAVLSPDITAMWNRMDPRSRANAEWYINNDVQPQLDKLYFTGTTSVLSPFYSYGPNGVQTLYGRPVNVTEFNASLNTTGDIVLADMSQYLLWEKSDIQAATSIHVAFLTDESVFRFVYRVDGKSSVASALTPYKGSTTTSPFVALTSAT